MAVRELWVVQVVVLNIQSEMGDVAVGLSEAAGLTVPALI